MKLDATLEIINNIAAGYRKNPACFSQLSLAKDQNSKYFLIVNNTKKPTADKFRVILVVLQNSFYIFYIVFVFYVAVE